jgi:hypothetical protein
MPFDIDSYINDLRDALEKLTPQARVGFAVWCADALFREVRDYLAGKTDRTELLAVQEAVEYLWKFAWGKKPVDSEVHRLEQACGAIDWDEEMVTESEDVMNVSAIEALNSLCWALETCRTGSALSAVKAAENILNKLDWQLSCELFVHTYSEAIWSDPRWKAELASQQKMLDFLRDNPSLKTEQKTLFRE